MNKLRSLLGAVAVSGLLGPAVGAASDRQDVSFDARVDFGALRTFAIGEGHINSDKPEIDNRLFRQRLEASIRTTLVKRGLTEVADRPDISVRYYFREKDVSAVERTASARIPDSPAARGFVIPGSGPRPVLYTEGSLVIDLYDASDSLLWRGSYYDQEDNSARLSRKLPEDARKILLKYPPRRKYPIAK